MPHGNRIDWNRIEWNRIESNRLESNRIESNGIESIGIESIGIESTRLESNRLDWDRRNQGSVGWGRPWRVWSKTGRSGVGLGSVWGRSGRVLADPGLAPRELKKCPGGTFGWGARKVPREALFGWGARKVPGRHFWAGEPGIRLGGTFWGSWRLEWSFPRHIRGGGFRN